MDNQNVSKVSNIKKITLDAIKAECRFEFGRFMVESLRIDILSDVFKNDVAVRMRSLIPCQKQPITYKVKIDIPMTWWDQFKLEKFPKKWLKRYPAKLKTITKSIEVEHYKLFPKLDVPYKGSDQVVFFQQQKQ